MATNSEDSLIWTPSQNDETRGIVSFILQDLLPCYDKPYSNNHKCTPGWGGCNGPHCHFLLLTFLLNGIECLLQKFHIAIGGLKVCSPTHRAGTQCRIKVCQMVHQSVPYLHKDSDKLRSRGGWTPHGGRGQGESVSSPPIHGQNTCRGQPIIFQLPTTKRVHARLLSRAGKQLTVATAFS